MKQLQQLLHQFISKFHCFKGFFIAAACKKKKKIVHEVLNYFEEMIELMLLGTVLIAEQCLKLCLDWL